MGAKPLLSDASFPQLHASTSVASTGTVSGTSIQIGNTVAITSSKGGTWQGTIVSDAGGGDWDASVTMSASAPLGLDQIDITVTNPSGTSNTEKKDTDVIP